MKKITALLLIVILLICMTACRKMPDNNGSSATTSIIDDIIYGSEDSGDTQLSPRILKSTIKTPGYVYFYNGGKYGTSTDSQLNFEIAAKIESWFQDYETPPTANITVDYDLITDIKCNQKAIELAFYNTDHEINLLGTINLKPANKLLIPLTGQYKYYVFVGNYGKYQNNPYNLNGSGLEKYFEGITLDKKAQDWQSTVIAPTSVIFYKDGMQSVSTDKEFNHKIAQHIEGWFKYEETYGVANMAATTDVIDYNRQNEMAIELQFDGEIKFYGGIIAPNARTLFIPITGSNDNLIFNNSIDAPDDWTGPLAAGGRGLEQFFTGIQFTPLTEEEKRWRSTVSTPHHIEFYENGRLIYESQDYGGYKLNREIAKHIESWFYKKENISTITVSNQPLETAWGNDTYIKLWFGGSDITFYGKNIVSEKSSYLIIPLTGEYAYHIFEGDYDGFSNVAYITGGSGLDKFFDIINDNNNS